MLPQIELNQIEGACLQVSCSILGVCHNLLLAWGEMRHLGQVTWLVISKGRFLPWQLAYRDCPLAFLPGSSGAQDPSLCTYSTTYPTA